MSDVHVLVDLENVRPPADHLENVSPKFVRAWVFHAPQDKKAGLEFAVIGERLTLVPISRSGKNALDFHLSFYLGYVAARNPTAQLVVVSNDKGYEPMIEHAVALGFMVRREGYAAPRKSGAAKVIPAKKVAAKKVAAKKATPATRKVAAKKAAPASKTAPAKKAPAAKKALPVKKEPAATKKAAARKPVPVKRPAAAKTGSSASTALVASADLQRVVKAISKMGDERPRKMAKFLRHVGSMLGKGASDEAIAQTVQHLQKSGVIAVEADKVRYPSAASTRP